jgi:chitodextrinase
MRFFPLIIVTGLLAACGVDSGSIGNDPSDVNDPSNVAPTAIFTAVCAPHSLHCNFNNASADPDGTIDVFLWDFGDNSAHASTRHAGHTYAAPGGLFTVTLTVTDDGGETATVAQQVEVNANVAPTADFAASCGGVSCAFTDESSDSNPGDAVASYTWDFGDGGTSTEANPVHNYAAAGTYTVGLTVTDHLAETGHVSRQVTLPLEPEAFPLLYARVAPHTSGGRSRYALYKDGTFVLRYPPDYEFGGEYRGRYSWGNVTINFDFEANPGQWSATGIIHGDSLSVAYTVVMRIDGFEDGVYLRTGR